MSDLEDMFNLMVESKCKPENDWVIDWDSMEHHCDKHNLTLEGYCDATGARFYSCPHQYGTRLFNKDNLVFEILD